MKNCEFIQECSFTWEELKETKSSERKYCGQCKQNVFKSYTEADLQVHSALKHCIYISDEHEISSEIGKVGGSIEYMDWLEGYDYSIFISMNDGWSNDDKRFLHDFFDKKFSEIQIQSILNGEKLFLMEAYKEEAEELVNMVSDTKIKIELVQNQSMPN